MIAKAGETHGLRTALFELVLAGFISRFLWWEGRGKLPERVLSLKFYMNVPTGPPKLDFLYINFSHNYPPIGIPFLKEKHPFLLKLGAFYHNLPKINPIYVIWALSSLMKTNWSLYQILRNSTPKGRYIHVYHVNVRNPPGGKLLSLSFLCIVCRK